MYKRTFLIIGLICIGFVSKAQNFDLGIKAHPLFGWMKPDQGSNSGAFTGFSYGLMGDFYVKERYAFSTEFAVTSMGGTIIEGDSQNGIETTYKIKYIEIPLSMKLKTNKMGQGQFYGQFGFVPGFNIGAKASGTQTVGGISTDFDDKNVQDNINGARLGLLIGGGYEYYFDNSTRLALGLSFNNGFTDVFDNGKATNSYMALNVGIFF
ncbi:PorT family protein [Solitalea longa]|uniref:PorT family protein n=1 Tax=Solitalea longa TaxID=2079460 RepID=A0A2S4ZXK1_9SPHI|nr:porin family protein [Solitalea longa]POY35091.1 PorT family protein [Solitalea longa]